MGEVEFFNNVKKVNRFLSNEARIEIWEFIINGEFVPIKNLLNKKEIK